MRMIFQSAYIPYMYMIFQTEAHCDLVKKIDPYKNGIMGNNATHTTGKATDASYQLARWPASCFKECSINALRPRQNCWHFANNISGMRNNFYDITSPQCVNAWGISEKLKHMLVYFRRSTHNHLAFSGNTRWKIVLFKFISHSIIYEIIPEWK